MYLRWPSTNTMLWSSCGGIDGPDFLPSNSLLEGSPRNRQEQVGETTTYEVHYFSTLANTLANQATVNLGLGVPETKIIQDRAYNSKSLSSAYKQLTPVQDVQWDYRADPTKLVLDFGSGLLTDDMMPLGPRRGEVFITARTSEDGGDFYCAAERYRAVTLVTRDAVVADTVSGILANMCINTISNRLIIFECVVLPSLTGDNHRVS